jgi:hypothetical protein
MAKVPSKAEIKAEIDKLKKELFEEFGDEVEKLQDELKIMTPVDTGFLVDSWNEPKYKGNGVYQLSNYANYAEQILMIGLQNGKGSRKLPQGVLPHVRMWADKLNSK